MASLPKAGKSRGFLDNAHLLVTIVVAGLGAFISWKQANIEEEQRTIAGLIEQQQQQLQNRLTITEQSAQLLEKARASLARLNLGEEKNTRILLLLMKIEQEIRTSKSGELTDKKIKATVDALPYHLALLAGDSEALAHIGAKPEDLNLWVPIAETSGDLEVRKAAIGALKNVAMLTQDQETIKRCIKSITQLTRRWNVPDLAEPARAAIVAIAKSYRHEDSAKQNELNTLIADALRELEGSFLAIAEAQSVLTVPTLPLVDTGPLPATDAPDTVFKIEAAQTADYLNTRQVRQFYQPDTPGDPSGAILKELVDELNSDEATKRRVARSKISDYGEKAIPSLLKALAANPDDYQTKIGVVTSLALMDPSVSLGTEGFARLVGLLGDRDETLRKNTAFFLVRLTDKASLNAVRQELEDLSAEQANLANPNLIYNSVIVLGEWLRSNRDIPDDQRPRIITSLGIIDERLESDKYHDWTKTRTTIGKYLKG